MVGQVTFDVSPASLAENRPHLFSPFVRWIRELHESVPVNEIGLPEGIYRADLLRTLFDSAESHQHPELTSSSEHPTSLERTTYDEAPSLNSAPTLDAYLGDQRTEELTPPPELDDRVSDDGIKNEVRRSDGITKKTGEIVSRNDLAVAWFPLSYEDGYPIQPSGLPFWTRLEFEPTELYHAFEYYLNQGSRGARQLYSCAEMSNLQYSVIRDAYYIYCWNLRAKSHDMFKAAEHRRIRMLRARSVDDEHYNTATILHEKAMQYIGGDEFDDLMDPKIALEALKIAAQMQRISAGLSPNAPGNGEGKRSGGSAFISEEQLDLRVIMRQLAGQDDRTIDQNGHNIDTDEDIARILDDPDATRAAQDLIISVSRRKSQIRTNNDGTQNYNQAYEPGALDVYHDDDD